MTITTLLNNLTAGHAGMALMSLLATSLVLFVALVVCIARLTAAETSAARRRPILTLALAVAVGCFASIALAAGYNVRLQDLAGWMLRHSLFMTIVALVMAFIFGNRAPAPRPVSGTHRRLSSFGDDEDSSSSAGDSGLITNPSTGYAMVEGTSVDIMGNALGDGDMFD